jgi:serine/threonine protein phosphatase PrpC
LANRTPHDYVLGFLNQALPNIPKTKAAFLTQFAQDPQVVALAQQILDNQQLIMDRYTISNRVNDIDRTHCMIPNGTTDKPYSATIDFVKLQWDDLVDIELEGLEEIGLVYDNATETISGTPNRAGNFALFLKYRLHGETENAPLHERKITLIINPNAKSLWKNLPSNEADPFHKPDVATAFAPLGKDRSVVIASKRGRSHANIGSFRDDDFAFANLADGWSVVIVADGAGSASLSREGSRIACAAVVEYLQGSLDQVDSVDFYKKLYEYETAEDKTETNKYISLFAYEHLAKAAHFAFRKIQTAADEQQKTLKDFHTTLLFTLYKTNDFGTAFFTFSVGDCPAAVLSSDLETVHLMNWLDVGDFGGGTRFLTMPEIFTKTDTFQTRLRFKIIKDFAYLILMTDGVYDPKFSVEANLDKPAHWQNFIKDLKGENDDHVAVDFTPDNADIETQLSAWLDFWSAGNHDDRTIAVVF